MLAGGGNLVQVFLHLVRLIDVGGSQSGKADDRIHPKNPKYLKVVWGVGYKMEKQ